MRPSKEKGFNRAGECATGRLEMDCREKDRPVAGVGGGARGRAAPEEDPEFHPPRSTFPTAWHWIRIADE
jgi:hypothetical protein